MAAVTAPVGLEMTVSAKAMHPDEREQHTN